MRFKTDENLPPEAAAVLRRHGHDAITVWYQQLEGETDAALLQICRRESRTLMTLDIGFADIRRYSPDEGPGVIVFRLASQSRSRVLTVIEQLTPLFDTEQVVGHLWIVSERGVRIHGKEE